MKNVWNIGSWIFGFVLLMAMLAFSSSRKDDVRINGIEVKVDHSKMQYFISDEDVENIIRDEYPFIDSLLFREINTYVLEERLDNHPSIRKAEVYSALDGTLRVDVSQKQPLFRVHRSGGDYYIAEKGDSMALSPNFSAQVPLVTGALSAETEQQIFEFFEHTQQNEFYKNFFSGIDVAENGEWILFPNPGRHKVLLGTPEDVEHKLSKLQSFYKSVVDKKNIDSIKTLNLAFEGQVVCTKY